MLNNQKYMLSILCFMFFSILSGQSMQELTKMKKEYDKIKDSDVLVPPIAPEVEITSGTPGESEILPYTLEENSDSIDVQLEYYGYDFFTKRDTVSFWENLPTPADYLLGPGDELIISLWGETQLRKTYTISREGSIYDDKVGLLNPMGKSIKEAEKYFREQFGRIYATLLGSNPSTFIDVSIGKLRSININFVGELNFPGVFPIHPFSTVLTGLIQAGGVDTTGSLRNIQIKRNGKIVSSIDLYNYLLKGEISKNIQLQDQDVVVVPVRLSTITVDSSVVRPGIYEAKSNETVKNLIDYAGGIKPNASSTIGIIRIIPINERTALGPPITNYYINYNESKSWPVVDGDKLTVRSIFNYSSEVEIIGQVKNPGKYHYFQGMRLLDLIELSGGFHDTTFWKSIYHKQGELIRRNPNTRYETVINIDLNKLKNKDLGSNIELQNLDRFVIHANRNFIEKASVKISGEVNIPGLYPLISDNETLESVINRAGSLTEKALVNGISIFRDKKYFDDHSIIVSRDNFMDLSEDNSNNLSTIKVKISDIERDEKVRVAWQNESIILMPGDSIIVKESTRTVNISGGVYNPGLVEYREGKSLRYYINASGGINERGNPNGIVIVYGNGVVKPKRWYSNPKINDGSMIIVNEKIPDQPFNLTEFATNWTSIISSIVTIAILSKQISS